ncbi:MAG TPA: cupredoxin domain-containing protein [Actinomycetota bacterium]
MRATIRCVVVALALVLLAPAVGAHERGGESSGATLVARVRVIDFGFRPRTLMIARGTVVRWVNRGARTHTTTSNTGLWNHRLAPGETFRRRFRRMGTFAYHCSIHPQMTGTITVS